MLLSVHDYFITPLLDFVYWRGFNHLITQKNMFELSLPKKLSHSTPFKIKLCYEAIMKGIPPEFS